MCWNRNGGGRSTIIQASLDQSLRLWMRDRRSKDARSITIRDLLEKKGGEAMKGSASLLSLGASRAAGSWIG
jgi:hypothetical protein